MGEGKFLYIGCSYVPYCNMVLIIAHHSFITQSLMLGSLVHRPLSDFFLEKSVINLKSDLATLVQQSFLAVKNPKIYSVTLVQQSFLAVKNPKIYSVTLVQQSFLAVTNLKIDLATLVQQSFLAVKNPKIDLANLVQQSFLAVKYDLATLVQHREITFQPT